MANERWLPSYTVESIMISVISMMSDPCDQGRYLVNVVAAKEWRLNSPEFKRKVFSCVRRSQRKL